MNLRRILNNLLFVAADRSKKYEYMLEIYRSQSSALIEQTRGTHCVVVDSSCEFPTVCAIRAAAFVQCRQLKNLVLISCSYTYTIELKHRALLRLCKTAFI